MLRVSRNSKSFFHSLKIIGDMGYLAPSVRSTPPIAPVDVCVGLKSRSGHLINWPSPLSTGDKKISGQQVSRGGNPDKSFNT